MKIRGFVVRSSNIFFGAGSSIRTSNPSFAGTVMRTVPAFFVLARNMSHPEFFASFAYPCSLVILPGTVRSTRGKFVKTCRRVDGSRQATVPSQVH